MSAPQELEEECDEHSILESLESAHCETLCALLEPLATDHKVTLCVNEEGIRVFGTKEAVEKASSEFKELLEEAGEGLSTLSGFRSFTDALKRRAGSQNPGEERQERLGAVLTQMPPARPLSPSVKPLQTEETSHPTDVHVHQFLMGTSSSRSFFVAEALSDFCLSCVRLGLLHVSCCYRAAALQEVRLLPHMWLRALLWELWSRGLA